MPAKARVTRDMKLAKREEFTGGNTTLDDYEREHREDIPEWTEAGLARSLPVSEFPELAEMFERARGRRGPQKAPVKERVGLRLDRAVLDHFRASGKGWQTRINDALETYIAESGKKSR